MGATWAQLFPPSPPLTEANLPSQAGKVFVVTGGYSGIGFHLSSILYHAGGKVYIAGRNRSKAVVAIEKIRALATSKSGELEFILLQLHDLSTIKASAENLLSKELYIDVLFNNAGINNPPRKSTSVQGYELQMGTNVIGPWLFTQFLYPSLVATARIRPPGSVRVIWSGSQMAEFSPHGGLRMGSIRSGKTFRIPIRKYITSKIGNWFIASELSKRTPGDGVLSICQNPGLVRTEMMRHQKGWEMMMRPLLNHARMGAYTELWAGLAEDITPEMSGGYVVPWGRFHPKPRADILAALKSKDKGGTGEAEEFTDWINEQVRQFL